MHSAKKYSHDQQIISNLCQVVYRIIISIHEERKYYVYRSHSERDIYLCRRFFGQVHALSLQTRRRAAASSLPTRGENAFYIYVHLSSLPQKRLELLYPV